MGQSVYSHSSYVIQQRLNELQEDLEDAVFVDLDTNTVTSEHNDLNKLPWNVVSFEFRLL